MNVKGTELLKIFEERKEKLSWWQVFKHKKIDSGIERLKELGLNDYYWEFNDVWKRAETFDPDLSVRNKIKTKEIKEGNECVGSCPNCKYGAIFEKDPIEKIGQCHDCFEEFKLSKGEVHGNK